MDDDLQQLEAELKRLRPLAPSRGLDQRVARDLAAEAPRRHAVPMAWLWAGALPAAAAVAIMLTLGGRHADPKKSAGSSRSVEAGLGNLSALASPAFKPVSAENVLYASGNDGIFTLDDGTAARRERLSYVDTITWKDPRTNASVSWSVPREEVRIVPVVFQ